MILLLLLLLLDSSYGQFLEIPQSVLPENTSPNDLFGGQLYRPPQQALNAFEADPFAANDLCLFPRQQSQTPNVRRDPANVDWAMIDRRCDEAWWHMYPFGERYYDADAAYRPWFDKQIDLDFWFPFYGFRFNYTFIFPTGFVAFSFPDYVQPPYNYPNPRWPKEQDPSFVAAFLTDQTFMFVGDTGISHVWYRIISRPIREVGLDFSATGQNFGTTAQSQQSSFTGQRPTMVHKGPDGKPRYRSKDGTKPRIQEGMVEDPDLLDKITSDIHEGMVGARGFKAEYALIVTWERMAYGGAPRQLRLNEFEPTKREQNTYQLTLATDEIRSYAIFNYGNINWTSSTAAGALTGRGGKQSALVGFNGGNGTGMFNMPWSAEGNSYKLSQEGATESAGQWLARVDEEIIYGGCSNNSNGRIQMDYQFVNMLGGQSFNVSGPCFRSGHSIVVIYDDATILCQRISMVKARCPVPIQTLYRVGPNEAALSLDGGKTYNWFGFFYIMQPNLMPPEVGLLNLGDWFSYDATNLTLRWAPTNISALTNQKVDITVFSYWEDLQTHGWDQVGILAEAVENNGVYSFNPRLLMRDELVERWYERMHFGAVHVAVHDMQVDDYGDGSYWSELVPIGWLNAPVYEEEYGQEWPLELCKRWYAEDGRKYQFWKEVEADFSCPCSFGQAVMAKGHFMPHPHCDPFGDSLCSEYPGAGGCFISIYPTWLGAAQTCCYDFEGWLMFSQDYEANSDYDRFYSAGTPTRSHIYGTNPYMRPPFVPALSHFHNDRFPYQTCCAWSNHCEFYFWRRESSGCQTYLPGTTGFAYGHVHFLTYDGVPYTFNGKGYFVLSSFESHETDLMVQVRMERPPRPDWQDPVPATVITGVAIADNGSDPIEIYVRREFRRWRYKLDVYAFGYRVFLDTPFQKFQSAGGVSIYSMAYNMNMSHIEVQFASGVALTAIEQHGTLDIRVTLPHTYNFSFQDDSMTHQYGQGFGSEGAQFRGLGGGGGQQRFFQDVDINCDRHFVTAGLLGTWNNRIDDDFLTPDCGTHTIPERDEQNKQRHLEATRDFGEEWRVDGQDIPLLFSPEFDIPVYDPLDFADTRPFRAATDPWNRRPPGSQLTITPARAKSVCAGSLSCEFDYLVTGKKEHALTTLRNEREFMGTQDADSFILTSCGPLQKNDQIIKFPPGNNYLDGITVTFSCQPEYFRHGDEFRTCVNGTWSPGWWAWCRSRTEELALKLLTSVVTILLFVVLIVAVLSWCYFTNVRGRIAAGSHRKKHRSSKPSTTTITDSYLSKGYNASTTPTSAEATPKLLPVVIRPLPEDRPIAKEDVQMTTAPPPVAMPRYQPVQPTFPSHPPYDEPPRNRVSISTLSTTDGGTLRRQQQTQV